MTNIEFLRIAQERLQSHADELARMNGASRDRTLDDLRFNAGIVHGLLQATVMMEEALKTAAMDPDD